MGKSVVEWKPSKKLGGVLKRKVAALGVSRGAMCRFLGISYVAWWRWQAGRGPVPCWFFKVLFLLEVMDRRDAGWAKCMVLGLADPVGAARELAGLESDTLEMFPEVKKGAGAKKAGKAGAKRGGRGRGVVKKG